MRRGQGAVSRVLPCRQWHGPAPLCCRQSCRLQPAAACALSWVCACQRAVGCCAAPRILRTLPARHGDFADRSQGADGQHCCPGVKVPTQFVNAPDGAYNVRPARGACLPADGWRSAPAPAAEWVQLSRACTGHAMAPAFCTEPWHLHHNRRLAALTAILAPVAGAALAAHHQKLAERVGACRSWSQATTWPCFSWTAPPQLDPPCPLGAPRRADSLMCGQPAQLGCKELPPAHTHAALPWCGTCASVMSCARSGQGPSQKKTCPWQDSGRPLSAHQLPGRLHLPPDPSMHSDRCQGCLDLYSASSTQAPDAEEPAGLGVLG